MEEIPPPKIIIESVEPEDVELAAKILQVVDVLSGYAEEAKGQQDTPSSSRSPSPFSMGDVEDLTTVVDATTSRFDRLQVKLLKDVNDATVGAVQINSQFQLLRSQKDKVEKAREALNTALIQNKMMKEWQNQEEQDEELQEKFMEVEVTVASRINSTGDQEGNPTPGSVFIPPAFRHNSKDLPQLTGNVKDWLPFWAWFKEIDEDKHLTKVQKMQFLFKGTAGEARDIITGYTIDEDNYQAALDHMKEVYGRDNVLIKVYVRELLQLAIDRSQGKKIEFRKLVNTITAHLRNLKMLKVAEDGSGQVIYPIVEACLPHHVLSAWQHHPEYSDELDELVKFLLKEVNHETERKLAHFAFPQSTEKKPGIKVEKTSPPWKKGTGGKKESPPPTAATLHNKPASSSCIFCDGRHPSTECRRAMQMGSVDKESKIRDRGACYACLELGHSSKKCPNRENLKCGICQKNHHKVLCRILDLGSESSSNDPNISNKGNNSSDDWRATASSSFNSSGGAAHTGASNPSPSTSSSATFKNRVVASRVPLQVIMFKVTGGRGKSKVVRAMLDTGSQKSYITEDLQNELNFEVVGEEEVIHQLFGGITTPSMVHNVVKLCASGVNGESPVTFAVSCLPKIAEYIPSPAGGPWIEEFMRRGIIFQQFPEEPAEIQVLLGNDVVPRLYTGAIEDLGTGPVAMQTRWGWVLCGKLPPPPLPGPNYTRSSLCITRTFVDLPLSALWDLDRLGITDQATTQSKQELALEAEKHFQKTVRRSEDGRYEVKLPFLIGAQATLTSNYHAAERRLKLTTEKLKLEGYVEQYDQLFKQWEADRMIETVPVSNEDWKEVGHFLPHHAVVKLSSSTTPIRPVFDASAKPKGRPSLNMCLEVGPNYLELIPSILTRFRLGGFGLTADIKKAFQMIEISPEHRPYLQFLWWEDPTTCSTIKVYRHTRVVFGVSCSPFLLAATLEHHLQQSPPTHMQSAEVLRRSLYVDNCLTSVSELNEALYFKQQCQELLLPACFDLRGWEIGPTGESKIVPVLGMLWDMKEDNLMLDLKSVMEKQGAPCTQRNVLATVHSLYDPLGMLTPYVIVGKLILRRCHEKKIGWDKPLPTDLEEEFHKWNKQMEVLNQLQFPRYVKYDRSCKVSLHVFSDASSEAYAAAVFLRCQTEEGVNVSLLQSKARIAPKGKITIPRLELIGCLIGARLSKTVKEDLLSTTIPVTYYSDSSTALAWISGDGPWGIFVSNRVREIKEISSPYQWKHVRGKDNPSDLPSRGCTARKLIESEWWEGPKWLCLPEIEWPVSSNFTYNPNEVEIEKKKTVAINLATVDPSPYQKFLRIASYQKILRLLSYWLRYRQRLWERTKLPREQKKKLRMSRQQNLITIPSYDELERAETYLLLFVQCGLEEKQLRKLRPFKDQNGVMRTVTRLLQEDEEILWPIILPDRDPFVEKLIRYLHLSNCHVGTHLLLAKVRERFWLLNGRRACRRAVYACWTCRRLNARRLEVPEPPLPAARTATGVPFEVTGVDIAGPLILRKKEKVWITLFTCATYRAIHLEVVDSLSTDAFFVAFRAFASRRGKPRTVYSDNGLNFVGAKAALQAIYQKEVEQFASERKIRWQFNPPSAAWWGGWWERLIGLVKNLLKRMLGNRSVHRGELVVLLLEVEEAINNRPLTYLAEAPDDPAPLTPNMMIRNTGLSYFPELDIRDATSARAAFKRVQRLREALRTRFRREYLGSLQFNRPDRAQIQLQPGNIVLIEQDNVKKILWPLAVVTEAIPGIDGVIRTYRLKTKAGIITRAAQKLYPMEMNEGVMQEPQPLQPVA